MVPKDINDDDDDDITHMTHPSMRVSCVKMVRKFQLVASGTVSKTRMSLPTRLNKYIF